MFLYFLLIPCYFRNTNSYLPPPPSLQNVGWGGKAFYGFYDDLWLEDFDSSPSSDRTPNNIKRNGEVRNCSERASYSWIYVHEI